jgi:methionine synthase / methylenetetrahydrofolate reductase(NADPH)
MIKEYLKKNLLITDGAMGTYYAEITGKYNVFPEQANIDAPEIIGRIHNEYIAAGAKLIKTNTFSANSIVLDIPRPDVEKIIAAGIEIAHRAAGNKKIFVAASIGPIPDIFDKVEIDHSVILDEYKFIADIFLDRKVKIFIFETFGDISQLPEIAGYIKKRDDSAFILTQFATTQEGFTRKGISIESIVAGVKMCRYIDAYGFNCGVGPSHLLKILKNIDFAGAIVAVAPNAGYPEIIHERTVYIQNTDYFAGKMKEISELGVRILGGCCGTTPAHTEKMASLIKPETAIIPAFRETPAKATVIPGKKKSEGFSSKLNNNQFVIAVELDPPFNSDPETVLKNARICKNHGVDVITIADSPMGKARADSIMFAAKIKREAGIEVIPHVCCRDKNIIAMKSAILAGYMENIRNVLAVTGDPVAASDKSSIKDVFNLNSFKLIELLSIMNREFFADDPVNIGGALNLNLLNPDVELSRMSKKIGLGARFFLTQPIFDDNVIDLLPRVKKLGGMKLLGGIMPLVSYRNAQFLNNEVAGIRIPERIINRFHPHMEKEEAENIGVETALEIAGRIKDSVHGFYFITPFNRVEMIINIIKKLRSSESCA